MCEYMSKPLLRGRWHSLKGYYRLKSGKKHKFSGHWNDTVEFEGETYRPLEHRKSKVVENGKLHSKSSGVVWGNYKEAVKQGDQPAASQYKKQVEEEQRARRKEQTDFVPRYFELLEKDGKPQWNFKGKFPKWRDPNVDVD